MKMKTKEKRKKKTSHTLLPHHCVIVASQPVIGGNVLIKLLQLQLQQRH